MLEFILKYWVEFLLSAIAGGLGFITKKLYSRVQSEIAEQKLLKEGITALQHNCLFIECRQCIARGEVTVEELQNLEMLYTSYHALGGNGTGTALYEKVKALQIKERGA